MKKNWKCIVGATLLAPVCFILITGVIGYLVYLDQTYCNSIIGFVLLGIGTIGLLIAFWAMFYEHCVNYWNKRGK